MNSTAEDALGEDTIKKKENTVHTIITVPSYFNEKQRQGIIDAAKLSLKNDKTIIVDEPVAAAYAYALQNKKAPKDKTRNIVVFDLGGQKLDVSLLNIVDEKINVIDGVSVPGLGGDVFDEKLVQHFCKDFDRKQGIDISKSKRALKKLRKHCEKAKLILSVAQKTSIEIESLSGGLDYHTVVSRARFEALCDADIKKCLKPVSTLLEKIN
eukprot:UN01966